jgi:peptide/nickel transport system permease protein
VRRYLAARALQAIGVVLAITTLTFVLVHLAPGDPLSISLDRPGITQAVRDQWRTAYGLDRPLPEQYVRWVVQAARGDLGWSYSHHQPVRAVLAEALPRTILLAGPALVLSFLVGVVTGVLQVERLGGARDRWLGRGLLALYSVPDFWLALVALLLFAYRVPLLPPGGLVDPVVHDYLSPAGRAMDRLRHLVLPLATLTLLSAAMIARYQRAALVEILPADWMRSALAKGLSWRSAVRRHALRNALLPTITLAGLSLPSLAGGAVFVEKVFSWPGMGLVTVDGIAARDYPLVTAGVLAISVVVVLGALLSDLALALADPRIRLD